jgi:hypothetical protein
VKWCDVSLAICLPRPCLHLQGHCGGDHVCSGASMGAVRGRG